MVQNDSFVGGPDPRAITPGSIGKTGKPESTPKVSDDGGVAFKALLERLQNQAEDLQQESREVGDPAGLAEAVDRAQASLDDALSLGDQLLEAYRRELLQPDSETAE